MQFYIIIILHIYIYKRIQIYVITKYREIYREIYSEIYREIYRIITVKYTVYNNKNTIIITNNDTNNNNYNNK